MDHGLLKKDDPVYKQSTIINHRSSMARAFTIVEMLVLIMTAPILMILVSGFFRSFIRDIPQATRLLQQNTTVLDMLDQLRRDADRAIGLPQQIGDRHADDATLLLEQPEAVVCYRFEKGQVVRTLMNGQGGSTPEDDRVWQARDAVIEWKPWVRDGDARAVEVHSHLMQRAAGKARPKFRSSHLFFIGNLAAGGEIR